MVIEKNKIFLIGFGNQLKRLRKEKGISQAQLAFEANIEISQISRIERGMINTTIVNAKLISKIFARHETFSALVSLTTQAAGMACRGTNQ